MIVFLCFSVLSNVVELIPHKPIEVSVVNEKYIFNGEEYNNKTQFGVVRGTYTVTNIPESYPFTFTSVDNTDSLHILSFENSTADGNKTYYFGTFKFSVLPTFVSASYASTPSNADVGGTPHKIRRMHMTNPLAKKPKRKTAKSTKEIAAILYGLATFFVGATLTQTAGISYGAYYKMVHSSNTDF